MQHVREIETASIVEQDGMCLYCNSVSVVHIPEKDGFVCNICGQFTTKEAMEKHGTPVKVYERAKGLELGRFRFFLRFLKTDFEPCKGCQHELEELLDKGDLILGNKDYEPAVELSIRWEIDDTAWKTVERREATREEIKTIPQWD